METSTERRPILLVNPVGERGVTPACPEAQFKAGDVVRVRRLKHLRHLPERAAVAIVVPPGFSPDHAMADAKGEGRPLMHAVPARTVTYIVAFDNNPVPHLLRERDLEATTEPPVEVRWAPREDR